jgi:uncharacterized protein
MTTQFNIIGVIHFLPLPGTPRACTLSEVMERALFDAHQLEQAGVRKVIIENFGDAPFRNGPVEPHIIAMMTSIAIAIRNETNLDLGINVLRNDSFAALAIASACNASFIRVNIHTGASWTDQGLIQGNAYSTLMYRKQLSSSTNIAADIFVKHGSPAGNLEIVDVAKDTIYRGLADHIILTGSGTGMPTKIGDVQLLRDTIPDADIWIGSGVNPDNINDFIQFANSAIVGTYFHKNSDITEPLCRDRVNRLMDKIII